MLILLSILLVTASAFDFDDDFFDDEISNPIVRVHHGTLEGLWKESTKGRPYASFEGIPFAKPPIGKDRFQEPQPLEPWVGVLNATRPLTHCLQFDPLISENEGKEDCLYLNVYTRKLDADALLPVVVFIHGGAFMYGVGAVYSPIHLMDRDLVVVTMNYRLGPFGFLSTGDEAIPGNAGLKDQAFALKWIQQNIKRFGGNPASVTLTGNSAGAASVHYHYLSPISRGTFHRGIALSGSAFAPWAHTLNPAEKAKQFAANLSCPITSSQAMLECLNEVSGEEILRASTTLFDWKLDLFSPFAPSVEGPGVKNPFLAQHPYQASKAGDMLDAPLIVTVTSEEGLYPAAVFQRDPDLLDDLEQEWVEGASDVFHFYDSLTLEQRESVADKIREHYLGDDIISLESFPKLLQAVSDRNFLANIGKLAHIHASKSSQPVYMYRYSFRGEKSFTMALTWSFQDYGVCHGDDMMHIFQLPFMSMKKPDDVKITEALVDMIYSFSVTGVPKLTQEGPEWLPVSPNSSTLDYLEISSPTKLEMKSSSDFGQRSFWDSLGFEES